MGYVCIDHLALGIEAHGPSCRVSLTSYANNTGKCDYCGAIARYVFN